MVALLYSAWAAMPAHAHALLLRSNPVSNAELPQAPAQVELFFSEPVQTGLSTIGVLDANGKSVDLGDVRVDASNPTRMTVSLGSLPDGVYTVTWKAISAIDGHLTSGSFPFAVGSGNEAALAGQSQKTSSELPASALISKWLLLASLALLVGQVSFVALVWEPSAASSGVAAPDEMGEPAVWRRIMQWALIGLFLGLGLNILSQAGQSIGSELAAPWSREAGQVLIDTRLGVIWLARLGLALIEVWLLQSDRARWKSWAGLATGLALLLSLSLTAHAATETEPAVPVLADWIHLIGMCVWLGGLPFLFTGIRALRSTSDASRTRQASALAERFSTLGLVSVGAIGVTGLYAAYFRVGSLQALYTSIYGQALLLKQVFVLSLLVLAAINLLWISPRLRKDSAAGAGNTRVVEHFAQMVLWEIVLGCVLLLSVSLLTYLPPAKIIPPSYQLGGTESAGDLRVHINVAPGTVGQNTFTVNLTANGQPVQAVKEALLRFTPAKSGVPPSEAQLLAQGNGNYSVKGSFLSLPSQWQIQVVVRRDGKFDAFANFNFSVLAPGAQRQSASTENAAGVIIMLDGLLFAVAVWSFAGRRRLPLAASSLLSLALIAGGMYFATRPATVGNEQANPIVPDAKSIAAGEALYVSHCFTCHGVGGKGDGPLGLTLIPRPADLTIHAVPGVHTDAQLFEWITDGFPGSAMPAWKSSLSDTDRWNLVNFIRTLAPKN